MGMFMTENDAIETLKLINTSRVHPFYDWQEISEVRDIAISALKEIQQYREIGTVKELKQLKEILPYLKSYRESLDSVVKSVVKRCNEYEQIGTVDEFREAMEKVKSLYAYVKQVVWERDIAIQQLEEIGVSLDEKIDSVKNRWKY